MGKPARGIWKVIIGTTRHPEQVRRRFITEYVPLLPVRASARLAAMIARVETSQNWLENITFQMNKMVRAEYCIPPPAPTAVLHEVSTTFSPHI
jgi:hypothetical protein